jgi:hypothetical protein
MEVSNRSGLGYTHLSRVENDSSVPSPETIRRADFVDLSVTRVMSKNQRRDAQGNRNGDSGFIVAS